MKKQILLSALAYIVAVAIWGCGVKNDPVAPATPDEIGHGKPLYTPQTVPSDGGTKKDKDDDEN